MPQPSPVCSLRTTCTKHNGEDRHALVLISASAKKARPGTTRLNKLAKKRSSPYVASSTLVITFQKKHLCD
jgi:hypothetical protein